MNEKKTAPKVTDAGKSTEKNESVSKISTDRPQSSPAEKKPGTEEQVPQQTVNVDDSNAVACYANFCRVSSTPEELILDLGLNPNPYSSNGTPINVSQRIIVNQFLHGFLEGGFRLPIPLGASTHTCPFVDD